MMVTLLGATTLVLVTLAPWVLSAAAGERPGGESRRRAGGRARSWATGAAMVLGATDPQPSILFAAAKIKPDLGSQINQEKVVFWVLCRRLPVTLVPVLGRARVPIPVKWQCQSLVSSLLLSGKVLRLSWPV